MENKRKLSLVRPITDLLELSKKEGINHKDVSQSDMLDSCLQVLNDLVSKANLDAGLGPDVHFAVKRAEEMSALIDWITIRKINDASDDSRARYFMVSYEGTSAGSLVRGQISLKCTDGKFVPRTIAGFISTHCKLTNVLLISCFELSRDEFES